MLCQVTWKTEPGLRGLSCSGFRAMETAQPDNERGVALEFTGAAQRDALLEALEQRFAAERFSNTAAAFETVKAFVLDWAVRNSG